jgi:dimethylhistidine N-methyltransferase
MATVVEEGRFTLTAVEPSSPAKTLAEEVRTGLGAVPKRLPCRFFYDEIGSRLFEAICALPEYYLTRTERAILAEHAGEIVERVPGYTTLVELGSGSAAKTRLLIEALCRSRTRLRYVPIDISRSALAQSAQGLLEAYPALTIDAVAAEYRDGLDCLAEAQTGSPRGPRLVLWLGSNVGNLDRAEAAAFLRHVRATMAPEDGLLLGIDRRKARTVLEPAYDDAQGVTAQLNKNVLARINRELGGRFHLDRFDHRAEYAEEPGRVALHLVSTTAQEVAIERLGLVVPFAAGEAIHTEDSYKYSDAEIDALATDSGFAVERQWHDPRRWFSVSLFRPEAHS